MYLNKLTKGSHGWICEVIKLDEDFSLALSVSILKQFWASKHYNKLGDKQESRKHFIKTLNLSNPSL